MECLCVSRCWLGVDLTNADDVELETTLQELALNLRGDAVETDMALGEDAARGHGGHLC